MKQLPLAITPPGDTAATFDNFVSAANAGVVAQLRALEDPSAPVFLWGPTGSGKTHLLRALVHEHTARGGRVGWFDAAERGPWADDPGRTLLVIDDCERLTAEQQREAFALFIEATQRRQQVAAAGLLPPIDLPLRDDLRSRLGWGLVFAVQPLAESDARVALKREAERRGIVLGDDVVRYLLTRFQRDLKSLIVLLDRLDVYSLAEKRAVTVPLLRRMLAEPFDATRGAMHS